MNKQPYSVRSDLEKARASALASLSLREHSVKELADKLSRKSYQDESIQHVIKECLERNYLNDERFAEMYWRNRSNKGFGPNKIRSELKHKGVNSSVIEQSSQQEELDFDEVIRKIYTKKFKGEPFKDFKDKIKRQNYLYQRGFDRELILLVIE